MKTIVSHKVADLICPPDNHKWSYVDALGEAFAGIRDDGKVVICWRGDHYVRMKPTLLVRIHNWLNGVGNRKWERQQGLR